MEGVLMTFLASNTDRRRMPAGSEHKLGVPPSPDSSLPAPSILLDGFTRFLQFLIDAEAEFLCGVPHHVQSPERLNYRLGYYRRKLTTPIGSFPLRVPHLRFFHARTPITKRAKRLAPDILDTLSRIHSNGATPAAASALIKLVWTLELPAPLLARLTAALVPILKQWRIQSSTGFQPVDGAAAKTVNQSGAAAPSFPVY